MTPPWLSPSVVRVLVRPRRVQVLRLLGQRPHTPTELSRRLGASASTVRNDLDLLRHAGLVVRREDDRVWAYHELTSQGRLFVVPGPVGPLAAGLVFAALAVIAASAAIALLPDPLPPGSMASPAPLDPRVAWLYIGAGIATLFAATTFIAAAVLVRARRRLDAP